MDVLSRMCPDKINSYSDNLPRSTRTPSVALPFDLSILDPNAVITEAQSGFLKATIALQQEKIAAIDSNILDVEARILDFEMAGGLEAEMASDLQAEMAGLHSQRMVLIEEQWFTKVPLAPARSVLPEILGIIFEHCLTLGRNNHYKGAPLLLTAVSRRWREVAHGTPSLWARIHVHQKLTKSLLLKFLSNSGSMPLDIIIPLGGVRTKQTQRMWSGWQKTSRHHDHIQSISTQRHRIRSVSIGCGDQSATINLLHSAYMASLQELSVKFEFEYLRPVVDVDAPQLRCLALIHGATSLLPMIKPTVGLQHLRLSGEIGAGVIQSFLGRCPNIAELNLEVSVQDGLGTGSLAGPAFLPLLRRLEIKGPGTSFTLFSAVFRTPGLQVLALSKLMSTPALCSYLSRVGSNLTQLVLEETEIQPEHILTMFTSLKGLETLEFHKPVKNGVTVLFDILTPDEGAPASSWICPKLAHLKLSHVFLQFPEPILRLMERRGPSAISNGSANYLANIVLEKCSCLDFHSTHTAETTEMLRQRGQQIHVG